MADPPEAGEATEELVEVAEGYDVCGYQASVVATDADPPLAVHVGGELNIDGAGELIQGKLTDLAVDRWELVLGLGLDVPHVDDSHTAVVRHLRHDVGFGDFIVIFHQLCARCGALQLGDGGLELRDHGYEVPTTRGADEEPAGHASLQGSGAEMHMKTVINITK